MGRGKKIDQAASKVGAKNNEKKNGDVSRSKPSGGLYKYLILSVISLLIVPFVSWLLWQLGSPSISKTGDDLEVPLEVADHQKVSLFERYQVDYDAVLKLREENMKKYSYSYDKYGIDRRSQLSLQEFRDVYDGKWPVLITDVVPQWKAFNWSRDFFLEHYGQERVTMKAVDQALDDAINQAFPIFHELLDDTDVNPTTQKAIENAVSLALPIELFYKNTHKAFPNSWTYVEDELFIPMRPQLRSDIGDCIYLAEDYYQLFPEEVRPWNAMLLWGTQYSRSTMHMDPYNWTGTNAVIKGRKRWKMLPPGQDSLLYIKPDAMSGFPLNCKKYNSRVDGFEPDLKQHALYEDVEAITFDQLPGELLVIPTGWYHQAYNVEETIAVSSQVMNRNNYRIVLEEVLAAGNLDRKLLPPDIDKLPPPQQVALVMAMLDKKILERGKTVTDDALQQMKAPPKGNGHP